MSNLVKSAYVREKESENRLIDSNEMIAERLRQLTEQMEAQLTDDADAFEEGFAEGLDAEQVEELMADRDAPPKEPDLAARIDEAKEELARLQEQADLVVQDAKEQADALVAKAQEDADAIREQARSDGHEEGYQAGYNEAMEKVREAEEELENRRAGLEAEYENRLAEMEPQLMNVMCEIYQHVLGIDLSGRSDVVMYLLQRAMQTIEGGTNYLVHVSSEDHPYALEHKDELTGNIGLNGSLELIEDHTLKQGQCYIETESGIFDCSFGVEMELLSKELKLLSRTDD